MASSWIRALTPWPRDVEKSLFRHLKHDALEDQFVSINNNYFFLQELAASLHVETGEHLTFEMVKEKIDSLE